MSQFAAQSSNEAILATDLDGTLIPLDGNEQNKQDLVTLAGRLNDNNIQLIYVTGRHFESLMEMQQKHQLPMPEWIICDVGTSIYRRQPAGDYQRIADYQEHQDRIISSLPIRTLQERVSSSVEGLRLQEDEKQGRFKLSYYTDADQLEQRYHQVQQKLDEWDAPYSIIHSVDPFNGDGLIDLLPADVSKAHALGWWVRHADLHPDDLVFAGDSGNDYAALTAGYRAIVVGNADRKLAQRVYEAHTTAGWKNRLYLAREQATSALLEGSRWFELIESEPQDVSKLGATPLSQNTTHFRVWAPKRKQIAVEIETESGSVQQPLSKQEYGYFAGTMKHAGPSAKYHYWLDEDLVRPDPTSRYQPAGVHGQSQIIDPNLFPWSDQNWNGIPKRDLIIYELHVGTFTEAGTFRAARDRLPDLIALGITAVELMPVVQTPGRWNWGYDGVNLFAVRSSYGEPDDFKAFIDACHQAEISVILDVVYNHIGPEGNSLSDYGPYFSRKHKTPWGDAFNYDGRSAAEVRAFIISNAIYWLDEYHLDGLRLDAVHLMFDESVPSILDEIRIAVTNYEDQSAREIHLIAEANVYDDNLLASHDHCSAYDAIWCDCLMHSFYSLAMPELQLTNRKYHGAQDLLEALKYGFLYTGAEHRRVPVRAQLNQKNVSELRSLLSSYVVALQTHDVVGNHPEGKRIHQLTSRDFQKAAAALVLLYPSIPMVFMGEECAVDSPFLFFADFEDPRLRKAVDRGRQNEYPQHNWRNDLLPSNEQTYHNSQYHMVIENNDMYDWYRKLIALRKEGLREGWLQPEQLMVHYAAETQIFSLHYKSAKGSGIEIVSRLVPESSTNREAVTIQTDATLLLSSQPAPKNAHGEYALRCNHALILKR